MIEEWVDISGYEGIYMVSNMGRVLSIQRTRRGASGAPTTVDSRIVPPRTTTDGYLALTLSRDCVKKDMRVHRLVALAFIANPHNKPHINHIDNNKTNNSVSNLEWCTPMENSHHCRKTTLKDYRGENHVLSKLTSENVISIREMYKTGSTQVDLSKKFNVTQAQISIIVRGEQWKHLLTS